MPVPAHNLTTVTLPAHFFDAITQAVRQVAAGSVGPTDLDLIADSLHGQVWLNDMGFLSLMTEELAEYASVGLEAAEDPDQKLYYKTMLEFVQSLGAGLP